MGFSPLLSAFSCGVLLMVAVSAVFVKWHRQTQTRQEARLNGMLLRSLERGRQDGLRLGEEI